MLKIGSHLVAYNTVCNQLYDTKIMKITHKYYHCRKIRAITNANEEYFYTSDDILNLKDEIKLFIDANKTNIKYNYQKYNELNNRYIDIYHNLFIKVPILQKNLL